MDGETNSSEPQMIEAYARFRILELYGYLDKMKDAENEWNYLINHYLVTSPAFRYASMANTFWEKFHIQKDVGIACLAVRQEAEQYSEEVFNLFYEYGGSNHGPTLDTICPFHFDSGGE